VSQTRVLLADDNAAMLDHVKAMLLPEFEVVGAFPEGESVLSQYDGLQPDVVILDISMGGMSGIEVARRLHDTGRQAKIVFLTVHEDQDFVSAAIGAGGSAYVVKSRMGSDLVDAIHAALSGGLFISTFLPH
jgi:DNA-binding NarL/FixJ family response regulator